MNKQNKSLIHAVMHFRIVVCQMHEGDPWIAASAGTVAWSYSRIICKGSKVRAFNTYARADKVAQRENRRDAKKARKQAIKANKAQVVTAGHDVPITPWIVQLDSMSALWKAVPDRPQVFDPVTGKYRYSQRAEGECAIGANGVVRTFTSRVAADLFADEKNRPL